MKFDKPFNDDIRTIFNMMCHVKFSPGFLGAGVFYDVETGEDGPVMPDEFIAYFFDTTNKWRSNNHIRVLYNGSQYYAWYHDLIITPLDELPL